jgi:hypothetical protein
MPGAIYFWGYRGFKSLFHDDLGLGTNLASVLGLVCAFFYALATPYALRWLIIGRRRVQSFVAVLVVFGSAPLLHAFLDSNFNQATGEAQKWYIWLPGGEILPSDSAGFDPSTGIEKRRLTPQVADIIARQKKGLRPRQVLSDPRQLAFFDPVTGRPQIWYSVGPEGNYRLFDSEGFDPDNGALLLAVTDKVAPEIIHRAAEVAIQAQAEAKARADRATAEARDRVHRELQVLFGAGTYAPGVVIVGAKARQAKDPVSTQAARAIVLQLLANLRGNGEIGAELMPEVYDTVYYGALMRGDKDIFSESGLAQRVGAALLVLVDCTCRQTASLGGAVSCNMVADFRTLKENGLAESSDEWTETGVGATQDGAIARTVQLLIERHPVLPGKG